MDESSVTQSDGVTVAKRPRVVPGNEFGQLVDQLTSQRHLELILRELRAINVLLQTLVSTTSNPVGLDEVYETAALVHND